MKHVELSVQAQEHVGVLYFTCPPENRLHPDLVREVMQVLDEVETRDEVGALVFTSQDAKFFSTGLDLVWLMEHQGDAGKVREYLLAVNHLYQRCTLYPKPTVAALNGHTFAAGLFWAAHLDFRFMRQDRGWICLPEVDINIPLLPGMIAICQATMTPQGFRRLYYTGERLTGPQAMEIGFVEGVCSVDQLVPHCVQFAASLAKKRPRTYAEMKRRIREPIARLLEHEDPKLFESTLAIASEGAK
ncbi:MAG: enoyl-CoA hydratase/isomerase family protein [Myxococcales bacterium]|nr:enoyl-CoA hydratase/isomerase family protein [Myxococcales bacterium]